MCWNDVFRKVFTYNHWESINNVILGLGKMNFIHMWYLSVIKCVKYMLLSSNAMVLKVIEIYCVDREWKYLISQFDININNSLYV